MQINFDLSRSDNWESLFPYGTQTSDNGEAASYALGEDIHERLIEMKREKHISSSSRGAAAAVAEVVESESAVSRTFENPPSWVSPILLERTQYVIRYPPFGRRTVQYYCAKADFFARNVHPQVTPLHLLFIPSSLISFFCSYSFSSLPPTP